jgi:hypothetical protein
MDGAYIKNLPSGRAAQKTATYRILRFPQLAASVGTIISRLSDISWDVVMEGRRSWKDVGHGNIFYSARRHSYVWRVRLVIRY